MSRNLTAVFLLSLLAGCNSAGDPLPVTRTATAAEPPKSAAAAPADPKSKPAAPRRHALLVGCTKYDNLDPRTSLVGPANDVLLFRELLVDHFQFKDAPIVILAEGQGGVSTRPTYANIKRAFQNLANTAKSGDEVVILLGGHGYFVPDVNPNENDPEPDGLDECFLPCDTLKFNAGATTIGNAIRDDEIRQWIDAIRDRGAFVWYIADSCHSGSGSRDPKFDDEPPAEVSREPHFTDVGLDVETINAWMSLGVEKEKDAADTEKPRAVVPPEKPSQGQWVAIYGAQSYQTAPEMMLPKESDGKHQKMHGLLTFTLCQLLTKSEEPLTYGELLDKVAQQYASMGRQGPEPLVEGTGTIHQVLGPHEWPGRSRLRVIERDGRLRVTGGTLMGLSDGSILAVYGTITRKEGDVPIGYVKLSECSAGDAAATPCDADGNAVESKAKLLGYAQIVKLDYSYFSPLVFGVQQLDAQINAGKLAQDIEANVGTAAGPGALLVMQDKPDDANWIVRTRDGKAYLTPPTGWQVDRGPLTEQSETAVPGPEYGPFDLANAAQVQRLSDNIKTIAHAQNLLRMAPASDGSKLISGNVNVLLEVRKHANQGDTVGKPLDLSGGVPIVNPGDLIGFQITNKGQTKVDFTLLFIDSAYGVTAWYPKPNRVGDNRINPGKSVGPTFIGRAKISAKTTGVEHMLLIATESQGQAIDFAWLAQPGIQQRTAAHPLGILLSAVLTRKGTRSIEPADEETNSSYVMRTISWRVPSEARH